MDGRWGPALREPYRARGQPLPCWARGPMTGTGGVEPAVRVGGVEVRVGALSLSRASLSTRQRPVPSGLPRASQPE
uniref:Uncharacterized protein n=1 Tax=Setaria italica TaxID=4555 RepID=K3YFD1_SETIT